MQIDPEQMRALHEAAQGTFRQRVVAYLRQQLPVHTEPYTDDALLFKVSEFEKVAASYGLDSERAIAKWAYLALIAGEDFHAHPAIEPHLRRPDIDQNRKIDLLMRSLAGFLQAREGQGS